MSTIVDKFEKSTQKEKLDMLRIWDIEYYEEDNPSISDEDYDSCLRSYNSKYKKKYVSSLGKANSMFEKYEHTIPVLSLDKITTKEAFDDSLSKFNNNVVIEPKIDGLTVVYYPDGRMVSRGDGHYGEVLPFANKIPNLPKPLDKPVRMEVVLDKCVQNKFDNTKNPRNLAAGILRRKEYSDDIKYLAYYAYNILGEEDLDEVGQLDKLESSGFITPTYYIISDKKNSDAYGPKEISISEFETWSKTQPYETDGIVVKRNTTAKDAPISYTSHHPDNAIAFKFVSKQKHSTLRDIEWSPGRNKFTPVAIFDAVELGGNSITRASLHNLNIIDNLNVKVGADIIVTLKNEIIPQIVSSNGIGFEIIPPTECPYCGEKLSINDTKEVVCTNDKCELRILDTMYKISSKEGLDIEGLSEKAVDKLRKYVIDHYPEEKENAFRFLELSSEEIRDSGFSEYMSKKLSAEINKKLENVHAANFLYSCNVPGLGTSTSKDIMNKYDDLDDFIKNWNDSGKDIDGIGDVLFESIKSNLDYIEESKKHIKSFSKKEVFSRGKNESIVITGKLSHPKSYYEKLILAAGYIYSDSLTKDTTYLVIPDDNFVSSKTKKAQAYKTSILNENELMKLLNK